MRVAGDSARDAVRLGDEGVRGMSVEGDVVGAACLVLVAQAVPLEGVDLRE